MLQDIGKWREILNAITTRAESLTAALSLMSSVDALSSICNAHLQPFLDAFEATSIVGLHHRSFAGQTRPEAMAIVNQQPTRVEAYLKDYYSIDPVISYWMTQSHRECSIFRLSDARRSLNQSINRRYDEFLKTVDVGHILVFHICLQGARNGAPGETIILALQRRKELPDFSSRECEDAAAIAPILRQIIRGIGRSEPRQEVVDAARTFLRSCKDHALVVLNEELQPVAATSVAQNHSCYPSLLSRDRALIAELRSVIEARESDVADGSMMARSQTVHLASLERLGTEPDLWLARLSTQDFPKSGCELSLLTPRQRQVSALISQGYRNWQIAEILKISENTVVNHLSAIYDRTGVSGRTELAIKMAGDRLH